MGSLLRWQSPTVVCAHYVVVTPYAAWWLSASACGKDEISESFEGQNYGVGCPGGVEVVAHSLRDALLRHKDSDLALLKIDFKNAFNLVERDKFIKAASARFPALEAWTRWCYSHAPLDLRPRPHLPIVVWSATR